MQNFMKWPLVIAAIIVILRVLAEQVGAPESVNKVFGVTWLFFVVPIYFARKIAATNDPQPYKTLFLKTAIYVALVRLMLIPVYWLAYTFNWSAARFASEQGGVVGDDISPFNGYVFIPFAALLAWVVTATLFCGGIGALLLACQRRGQSNTSATR